MEIAVLLLVLGLTALVWLIQFERLGSADLTPVWILILFIAVGSFVLRRSMQRWGRLRDVKLLHGNSGLIKTLRNNTLIISAISLLIAGGGFVTALVSGDKFDMLRAAAVAIILLAINFPRRSVWHHIVDALNEV